MKTIWVLAATALLGPGLQAQKLDGVWQGTVDVGGTPFRQIVKFTKTDDGWKAVYYSPDEASDSVIATSAILDGRKLTLTLPRYFASSTGASYEGTLGADGHSLTGTWIEPDGRFPLTLRRVRGKDQWALPAAHHTARLIQVQPGVEIEVLD